MKWCSCKTIIIDKYMNFAYYWNTICLIIIISDIKNNDKAIHGSMIMLFEYLTTHMIIFQ